MKYNIAFIPKKNQEQFITFAEKVHKAAGIGAYLLGEHSIPHVSLCHFEAEELQIEKIWTEIKFLNIESIKLTFDEIRSKSYHGHPKWGGVSWVSLISDNLDQLKNIHLNVASIVKKPLNASFYQYDPHLTLLNSYNEQACLAFNYKLLNPLIDDFFMSLGPIDKNGQLLKIAYCG